MSLFSMYLESNSFKFLSGKKLMIDDQIITNERKLPNNSRFNLKTFQECLNYFKTKGIPEFITFDNDLGEVKEGIHLIDWIIEKDLDSPFLNNDFKFNIHSRNPVANKRMFDKLNDYRKFKKYNFIVTNYGYLTENWSKIK